MKQKTKKWTNPRLSRKLLNTRRLQRFIDKKKISAIYDLRSIVGDDKIKSLHYHQIDPVLIKNYIQLHSFKERIVLISEFQRTYVAILTWAKINKYKNVYIYKAGKEKLEITF